VASPTGPRRVRRKGVAFRPAKYCRERCTCSDDERRRRLCEERENGGGGDVDTDEGGGEATVTGRRCKAEKGKGGNSRVELDVEEWATAGLQRKDGLTDSEHLQSTKERLPVDWVYA
jgi:hypothetical protein